MTNNIALEILNGVRSFYDSAWDKLLWIIGVFGGIIVIAFPIFYTRYQKKQLKLSEEEVKNSLSNFIKEEMKKQEKLLESSMDARTFHVQGIAYGGLNMRDRQAHSYFEALLHTIKLNDHRNSKVLFKNIRNLFRKLNKKDIDSIEKRMEEDLQKYIEKLKHEDKNNQYFEEIKEIETEIAIAMGR